jgi:hypothetical protein
MLYVVRLNSLYSIDWYWVTVTASYRLHSTLSDKTKRLLTAGVVTEAMTTKNRGYPGLGIVEISKDEPGLFKIWAMDDQRQSNQQGKIQSNR